MGTSVFRIRTAVDFPPMLKSDHTMRSCRAASLQRRAADSFSGPARTPEPAGQTHTIGARVPLAPPCGGGMVRRFPDSIFGQGCSTGGTPGYLITEFIS